MDYPNTADGHRDRVKADEKAGKSSAPPVPDEGAPADEKKNEEISERPQKKK